MIREIIQDGHPILREQAQNIPVEDIKSPEIQKIIVDMKETLATQKDGVALAAPQIGIAKKIFIIAPFIFEKPEQEKLVYINPKISYQSKKTDWLGEGCLSCRWKIGEAKRSLETTIEAYDEHGNKFETHADGLLAHIFQHETDHFEGVLFIDKARNLREMTDEEIAETQA